MKPGDFLNSLGLGEYLAAFEENAIDEESLRSLTDSDLKELGVAKLGHRKKILEAMAAPQQSGSSAGALGELVAGLPNVVALPLREYAGEEHPVAKLWAMCDTVELLLRLMVVAFVSYQRERGGLSEKMAESLAGLVESPTLGAWFVMAQTLAKETDPTLKDAAGFVEGPLRDLLYGAEKPGTAETSLLRLRNRLAHGGGLTRREAARLLELWQPKFEKMIAAMQWLADWKLAGRDKQGRWLSLAGPEPGEADFTPQSPPEHVDAVWIKVGDASFPLWPLAVFGQARASGATKQGSEDLTQIYTRRENLRLAYTPVGAEGLAQSESGPTGFEAFKALFQLDRPKRTDFTVADFAAELRKDAAQAIGRDKETATIVEAVHRHVQGVLWISGAAGTGKSFLVAKALAEILDRGPGEQTLVLAYRFRASDQTRCSREALATFLEERLKAAGAIAPGEEQDRGEDAAKRIDNGLARLKAGWNTVVFLDGLDEIARGDAKFAEEVPLGIRPPNVLWVCSGRPESGLAKAMSSLGALALFPDGLPPMSQDDIRAMMLEKIGPLRKKLLAGDKEKGDAVVNPFIDLVTQRAAGLPLYVKYVIGDVLSGKYRVLDGQEDLPESLHAYHEELLRRLAVGDLQAVVTPLVATLACAHEPLSLQEITAILVHRKLLVAEGAEALVDEALAATASMLSTAPDPEGETGFTLFHQSLRDHMRGSEQMRQSIGTGIAALADLSIETNPPPPLTNYLLRCGVRHLLDANRREEAQALLLDLTHLGRMAELGVEADSIFPLWRLLGDEDRSLAYASALKEYLVSPSQEKLAVARFVVALSMASGWLGKLSEVAELSAVHHQEVLGPDDESSIKASLALAKCLHNLGLYAKSQDLTEGLLRHSRRLVGTESPLTIQCIATLAGILHSLGDHEGSEKLHREVLDLRTKLLGNDHPASLRSTRGLGTILCSLGKFEESELLLKSSHDGFNKMFGPVHSETLAGLSAMGNLLGETHRHQEACQMLDVAWQETGKALGFDHPLALNAMFWHARQLSLCGNSEAAESKLRSAYERVCRVYGKSGRNTLDVLNELANTLARMESFDEAENLYRQVASDFDRLYGKQSPAYLAAVGNLAQVLTETERYEEAERLATECRDGLESLHGSLHPDYFKAVDNLGKIARCSGNLEGAEKCFRETFEGRSAAIGLRHKSTLAAASYLGHTLQMKKNYEEAAHYFRVAAKGFEDLGGPDDDHALFNSDLLARALYRNGDLREAEVVADEVLKKHSKKHGDNSIQAAKAMALAAPVKAKLGNFADALDLYRKSFEIRKANLGHCHLEVLRTAFNLGEILRTQKRLDEESNLYSDLLDSLPTAPDIKMTVQQRKLIDKMRSRLASIGS
jgi:tetratricopeptide (TPR) repeat protein